MRFILALSVLISHSTPVFGMSIIGGGMAVQAFYVISGFYMSLVLNEKYINENSSYKLFISNRFLRLYPVYWAVLILSVAFCIVLFFIKHNSVNDPVTLFLSGENKLSFTSILFLGLANLSIFGMDLSFFMNTDAGGHLFFGSNISGSPPLHSYLFVPQGWSIALELMFYLIAPLILRRSYKLILLLIALSLLTRVVIFHSPGLNHDPWTGRFFPAELVFFLLGNISYHIYKKISQYHVNKLLLFGAMFSMAFITVFYVKLPFNIYYFYPVCFFISLPFIFMFTKKSKLDNFIGELSYPLYICHILVLLVIKALNIPLLESLGTTLLIGSILLSLFLNKIIADRVETIRQKRVKK